MAGGHGIIRARGDARHCPRGVRKRGSARPGSEAGRAGGFRADGFLAYRGPSREWARAGECRDCFLPHLGITTRWVGNISGAWRGSTGPGILCASDSMIGSTDNHNAMPAKATRRWPVWGIQILLLRLSSPDASDFPAGNGQTKARAAGHRICILVTGPPGMWNAPTDVHHRRLGAVHAAPRTRGGSGGSLKARTCLCDQRRAHPDVDATRLISS